MYSRYGFRFLLILSFLFIFSVNSLLAVEYHIVDQEGGDELSYEERRKFDYFFYQAMNAKALRNYDEAMDFLRHCHALDSTNAAVLVELGAFHNVLQEKDKALSYLQRAVKYDPDNYYYNMMLAAVCKELERKQDVVDIYKAMHDRYPEKMDLLFELSTAYAENGEMEKAIQMLNQLEKSTGITDMVTLNKFRYYSMMEQKKKAFGEIQHIIDKYPENPAYRVLMGDLYLEDQQPKNAWKYYEQAKAINPEFPALIVSRINYFEKQNRKDEAQQELKNAINSSAMEIETKVQLLTRYLTILEQENQDLRQANSLFESLFQQYPNYSRLNLIYGNVLLMQKDKEKALEQFHTYIKGNPSDPVGYEQIIRLALSEEDMKTLRDITTEGIKHIPKEPQFYFYLGAALYQENEYQKALDVFKEGLAQAEIVNPLLKSDFYGQIGDLNYFLGKKEEAFANYDKALQLNPQNLPVLNNYSYYLSLEKKNLDKAEKMSGITIKVEPMNPTYLDTYGWVLYEQGSYVMSRIYLEKAVEYSGEDVSAEVLEHYGDLLNKLGEHEKALLQWEKAKEVGGDEKALDLKIKNNTKESK